MTTGKRAGWALLTAAAMALCCIALGCMTVPSFSLPAVPAPRANADLPSRNVVVMGQLMIYSDHPLPQHHRLLEEVAQQREILLGQLGFEGSDEPIYVYLFESEERFQEFLERTYPKLPARRAFFVESDTRLSVFAHWGDRLAEDLRHEVAHGYLHSVAPRIPLWIDEGLAEYYELPRAAGGLHQQHLELLARKLNEGWRPQIARLESLNLAGDMTQLDYAESWAWTHWLLHASPRHKEVLCTFLHDVRRYGTGAPPGGPLSTRIRALRSPLSAEEALVAWLRHRAYGPPSGSSHETSPATTASAAGQP